MGKQLQGRPVHGDPGMIADRRVPQRIARYGDPQDDEPHMVHRGVSHEPLEVPLAQRGIGAENDGGCRQKGEGEGEAGGFRREERENNAQETIGPQF